MGTDHLAGPRGGSPGLPDARLAAPLPHLEFFEFKLSPFPAALGVMRRVHPPLRRHVRNWIATDLRYVLMLPRLRRGRGGKDAPIKLKVKLREGTELLCRSGREYHFLMQALKLACDIVGEDQVEEATSTVFRLMQQIRDRLAEVFTQEEIDRVSTGGYPALKEIVLYLLVRRFHPKVLLETGVAQGISTTFILEALRQNGEGELTSIDLPNFDSRGFRYPDAPGTVDHTYVKRELGTGWLVTDELRRRWNLLLGASREVLPRLGPVRLDMFFHDSEHSYENMAWEYSWARAHLVVGGLLVSDDIHWNRAFPDFLANHSGEFGVLADRKLGVVVRLADVLSSCKFGSSAPLTAVPGRAEAGPSP